MNTNESAPVLSAADHCANFGLSAVPPEHPIVPPEFVKTLLKTAPADTVILINDELYRRLQSSADGKWRHLEELATEGGSYLTYETWEKSSPEDLFWYASEFNTVRLVTIPNS